MDKDEEPRKRKVRTQGAPRPRPQAERRKAPPPPARPKPAPPAIPLPEEFWQSRTGKVYRKNREYTICPRCKENWKTAVSAVCQPCADVDGTRQKAAAKRLGTLAQKKKEERSHE